jgi:hypothetical protein
LSPRSFWRAFQRRARRDELGRDRAADVIDALMSNFLLSVDPDGPKFSRLRFLTAAMVGIGSSRGSVYVGLTTILNATLSFLWECLPKFALNE